MTAQPASSASGNLNQANRFNGKDLSEGNGIIGGRYHKINVKNYSDPSGTCC